MNFPTGMSAFVNSLNDDDFAALQIAVYRRERHERDARVASLPDLNKDELSKLSLNIITAIKLYKDRTGVSLIDAKTKVEVERDKLRG